MAKMLKLITVAQMFRWNRSFVFSLVYLFSLSSLVFTGRASHNPRPRPTHDRPTERSIDRPNSLTSPSISSSSRRPQPPGLGSRCTCSIAFIFVVVVLLPILVIVLFFFLVVHIDRIAKIFPLTQPPHGVFLSSWYDGYMYRSS
jgi:hypothetical protein